MAKLSRRFKNGNRNKGMVTTFGQSADFMLDTLRQFLETGRAPAVDSVVAGSRVSSDKVTLNSAA